MTTPKIHYDTFQELKEALMGSDYTISKKIVKAVSENITSKEKINVLECTAEDMEGIFDLELSPEDFVLCLEKNLIIHENAEDYEGCIKIVDLIEKVKNK